MPVINQNYSYKIVYSQKYAGILASGLMDDDREQLLVKAGSMKEITAAAAKYIINLERP